ncbi:hypothetical protein TGRUB_239365 [Toxoplasma gondii RUB]|uniref:Uncharacterized protein n=1 Tax=Toxoplasma gondii RUB TaxID=935652 RepID=A0A086LSN3_TOXGO|nr:hypothetical protein TGRUB_239365 [Toxoplasma gondii RUB]
MAGSSEPGVAVSCVGSTAGKADLSRRKNRSSCAASFAVVALLLLNALHSAQRVFAEDASVVGALKAAETPLVTPSSSLRVKAPSLFSEDKNELSTAQGLADKNTLPQDADDQTRKQVVTKETPASTVPRDTVQTKVGEADTNSQKAETSNAGGKAEVSEEPEQPGDKERTPEVDTAKEDTGGTPAQEKKGIQSGERIEHEDSEKEKQPTDESTPGAGTDIGGKTRETQTQTRTEVEKQSDGKLSSVTEMSEGEEGKEQQKEQGDGRGERKEGKKETNTTSSVADDRSSPSSQEEEKPSKPGIQSEKENGGKAPEDRNKESEDSGRPRDNSDDEDSDDDPPEDDSEDTDPRVGDPRKEKPRVDEPEEEKHHKDHPENDGPDEDDSGKAKPREDDSDDSDPREDDSDDADPRDGDSDDPDPDEDESDEPDPLDGDSDDPDPDEDESDDPDPLDGDSYEDRFEDDSDENEFGEFAFGEDDLDYGALYYEDDADREEAVEHGFFSVVDTAEQVKQDKIKFAERRRSDEEAEETQIENEREDRPHTPPPQMPPCWRVAVIGDSAGISASFPDLTTNDVLELFEFTNKTGIQMRRWPGILRHFLRRPFPGFVYTMAFEEFIPSGSEMVPPFAGVSPLDVREKCEGSGLTVSEVVNGEEEILERKARCEARRQGETDAREEPSGDADWQERKEQGGGQAEMKNAAGAALRCGADIEPMTTSPGSEEEESGGDWKSDLSVFPLQRRRPRPPVYYPVPVYPSPPYPMPPPGRTYPPYPYPLPSPYPYPVPSPSYPPIPLPVLPPTQYPPRERFPMYPPTQ